MQLQILAMKPYSNRQKWPIFVILRPFNCLTVFPRHKGWYINTATVCRSIVVVVGQVGKGVTT